MDRKLNEKKGVTLVEVMVAILVFTIVMLGGLAFFFYGRMHISHSNHQRMALGLTKEQVEILKATPYDELPAVDNENITLGGVDYSRNTVVTDGTGGGIYREVTVTTSWEEKGNTVSVQLVTVIAE